MLEFKHKDIRSAVLAEYFKEANIKDVVIFSCGNASRALKEACGDEVNIETPKTHDWWSVERIARTYKKHFDATSGHLPLWLMVRIGEAFKKQLGPLENRTYYIPTGSGETIMCLKLAYPAHEFVAVYNVNEGSKYEHSAPLNSIIKTHFKCYDHA